MKILVHLVALLIILMFLVVIVVLPVTLRVLELVHHAIASGGGQGPRGIDASGAAPPLQHPMLIFCSFAHTIFIPSF